MRGDSADRAGGEPYLYFRTSTFQGAILDAGERAGPFPEGGYMLVSRVGPAGPFSVPRFDSITQCSRKNGLL